MFQGEPQVSTTFTWDPCMVSLPTCSLKMASKINILHTELQKLPTHSALGIYGQHYHGSSEKKNYFKRPSKKRNYNMFIAAFYDKIEIDCK